jgi:hypothetical protein
VWAIFPLNPQPLRRARFLHQVIGKYPIPNHCRKTHTRKTHSKNGILNRRSLPTINAAQNGTKFGIKPKNANDLAMSIGRNDVDEVSTQVKTVITAANRSMKPQPLTFQQHFACESSVIMPPEFLHSLYAFSLSPLN